ncbi:hypothetical protein SLEP1_g30080 [Rubroshorea leprosula]|uniref:NAB domain-containing protein n=1 Tax=Rubroshorea leprosula TaxID=152421 RepID=A0AAV5K4R5_9ROSI|nr:hypothetical protein SLEP1_g30080 [Rubroshorea leprosula]
MGICKMTDMQDKVAHMLKIIEDDGDSFAKRAEMYYKKRPELISFVEETYRAHRALADRYDHLSKDLQNANRTIATVSPEQVQFSVDEEEDENLSRAYTSSPSPERPPLPKSGVPKVPFPKEEFRNSPKLLSRKGQLRRAPSSSRVATPPSSGLNKDEALEEIDKLQKEILVLQTEKEFIRSSCERGCQKYWKIENQITEKQKVVSSLQDEFGIGTFIQDNEARNLMATRAVKSCQETLVKLQEERQQSAKEVSIEYKRVTEALKKFQAIRTKFLAKAEQQEEDESVSLAALCCYRAVGAALPSSFAATVAALTPQLQQIKEQLEVNSNSCLTMSQLADKIDDLVQRVVNLETEVFSQNGMVKRLRSETNELEAQVRSLEEDKEALIEGSDIMRARMKELEEELSGVKDLVKTVIQQNNNLKSQFTKASCNLDHLSVKLQNVKMDEDDETTGTDEEGNQPNWRQLILNGLDDREKIFLEEYSSVLRAYKDVRKKINEVEQKNRDEFFEFALLIRELKHAVASRDGEILYLRQQTSCPHKIQDEDQESRVTRQEGSFASMSHGVSFANSTLSSPTSHHEQILNALTARGSSFTKEEEKEFLSQKRRMKQ